MYRRNLESLGFQALMPWYSGKIHMRSCLVSLAPRSPRGLRRSVDRQFVVGNGATAAAAAAIITCSQKSERVKRNEWQSQISRGRNNKAATVLCSAIRFGIPSIETSAQKRLMLVGPLTSYRQWIRAAIKKDVNSFHKRKQRQYH